MARRRTFSSQPVDPPDPRTARLVALRLLGRRDYTADELTRKLKDRGFLDDDVQEALARLAADGLLNDRRAAAAHVRTASHIKGRGPIRIRQELQARGVTPDVIGEVTRDLDDESVRDAIQKFLVRKRVQQPVPPDARPRLYQQLIRRGFPSRLVSAALKFVPED